MFRKLEVNTVLFFLALVLTNILISIILSKYITDPLKKLTAYITKVPENIQNPSKLPDFENSDNEISVLVREFKNMLTQLQTRERERDSAEKALRENETRYRNLSDMLPQGVFETDSDGILTYFNKTLASTLYFDESDTQRQIKITDILNADYEALMDHDYTYGLDYIASKHNGERFPVILYVSKIIKDNFITGLRCIMVDSRGIEPLLSDHRGKKLKSERSDNLKSEFLAN
jgi:transcriptional regulator with PAS, ATPase and Fis domain